MNMGTWSRGRCLCTKLKKTLTDNPCKRFYKRYWRGETGPSFIFLVVSRPLDPLLSDWTGVYKKAM